MRIVFVDTTNHLPVIGGGHLILPTLMAALKQRVHEVHLVVSQYPDEKIKHSINESGAIVHVRPWKKKGLIEDITPCFNNWIEQLKPDVYVISSSADIGWTVLPCLNPAIATFTIGHNNEETFYMPVRHYKPFLSKAIGVSKEICDQYTNSCAMPVQKVEWIPYGVEAADGIKENAADEPLRIVYVGRVEQEQKRIADLIAIAKKLYEARINFKLTIVGDGPDMPKLLAALKTEIENKAVEIAGWLDKREVLHTLRQSDVFILTSEFEGFSIALTEAIANGCCPVVTNIPSGNQQLINDGINGFLIEVGKVDDFVARLSELAANRPQLAAMRKAAWEKGQQYSVQKMAAAYELCFTNTIAAEKTTPRKKDKNFPLMSTCVSRYPKWLRRIKTKLIKE
jgi:glycosyltransferase involved in cell wall biosynthesis